MSAAPEERNLCRRWMPCRFPSPGGAASSEMTMALLRSSSIRVWRVLQRWRPYGTEDVWSRGGSWRRDGRGAAVPGGLAAAGGDVESAAHTVALRGVMMSAAPEERNLCRRRMARRFPSPGGAASSEMTMALLRSSSIRIWRVLHRWRPYGTEDVWSWKGSGRRDGARPCPEGQPQQVAISRELRLVLRRQSRASSASKR